ncbi:MFS transporter [Sinirhodobacter sp. HNIBRBA609]|nr:MFS transporter [Sinirhodobacter sp. HNIBRBA609]
MALSPRTAVLIVALWAAGLCAAAQFAKIAVPFVELRQAYPSSNSLLGLALSSISLLGIALGMIVGLLVARIGARRVLLASLALGALLSLFQATLPPLPLLIVTRVLEGASHLGLVVAAPTLIGTLAPPAWRGGAMTLWGTFFGVAFALVAWIGLPLVQVYGLGSLFVAHGVITALVGLLLLWLLPRDNGATSEARGTGGATKGARDILDRHWTAYASPRISAPAFGWLFYTFTFVALLTVLPQSVAATDRAFVAGAMPLASIAISMTLGVGLLRFLPAVTVVQIGFAVGGLVAMLLIALPVSPALCIALIGSLGLVQGASFAAIPQLNVTPGDQAMANGVMAQMGNLGNIAGTPVLLAALAMGGTALVMAIIIGCYAVAIAVHSVLARRRLTG